MAMLDDAATDLQRTVAVLQRELDQRTAERDEALAQQTATSDILGVISRSPTDVQPVFEAIVAHAASLCEAEFSVVARLEDGLLHLVAVHSMSPEETAAFHSLFPRAPGRHFVMGRAFVEAQPVHIEDVLAESDYDSRTLEVLQSVANYRSFLGVPIFREGRPIGVIGCGRREVKPFTATQIELVETFADQAAIAVENVRLFNEVESRNRDLGEALEQQTATAEVLQVINSSPGNLAPVFDAILEKAHTLCGATLGSLFLFDGELFRAAATYGYPEDLAQQLRQGVILSATTQLLDNSVRWVHNPDLTLVDTPTARAVSGRGGVRTNLMLPLRKDERLLGAISCNRQEVRPFSDKQIALLQNFAAQAVIAMENARLLTETREALEQQTATAEVLQVINSSPGDLAPVFDVMLEKATRLCEVDIGTLWTYDGEMVHAAAIRGAPPRLTEFLRQGPHRPAKPQQRVLSGERVVQIADITTTEAYRDHDPVPRAIADLGGVRTLLIVPLRKDDTVLGNFAIYRCEVRPFTDKQIALLENFAAQAVIAMENARLLTETREALEQQTATAEVLQVINSSPGDLAPVFDAMLEKAMRLCEATHGHVWRFDGELLHAVAARGDPHFVEWLQQHRSVRPIPGSAADRVVRGERLVHVADRREEGAYIGDPIFRGLVDTSGVRTSLSVALRRDETLLGMINVYRQEVRPFSDAQIALLQNFAEQAVIAMENVRLLNELNERTRDLEESLEYQTATSDVLKVISQSGGELEPVLETLVETAARICDADKAVLGHIRDGLYCMGASVGFTQEYKDYRARNPITFDRGTAIGRMAIERRVVHIEDASNDPEYTDVDTRELGQFRTVLSVPLFREDAVIGGIFLARSRVEPFSEKQIELVTTFADQAVIAIENARLLNELRDRTEEVMRREAELRVTFDNMADGVVMFDDDLRLAAWNRNFQQILDLPDAVLAERLSYADYVRYLAERGEFGDCRCRCGTARATRRMSAGNGRPNGRGRTGGSSRCGTTRCRAAGSS